MLSVLQLFDIPVSMQTIKLNIHLEQMLQFFTIEQLIMFKFDNFVRNKFHLSQNIRYKFLQVIFGCSLNFILFLFFETDVRLIMVNSLSFTSHHSRHPLLLTRTTPGWRSRSAGPLRSSACACSYLSFMELEESTRGLPIHSCIKEPFL
jgi:hypothetical protein